MKLHARLTKLEAAQRPQEADALTLALAPDLAARVETARQAGRFPHVLCTTDLRAVLEAGAKARGGHDQP